jgi:hypothetical protein
MAEVRGFVEEVVGKMAPPDILTVSGRQPAMHY